MTISKTHELAAKLGLHDLGAVTTLNMAGDQVHTPIIDIVTAMSVSLESGDAPTVGLAQFTEAANATFSMLSRGHREFDTDRFPKLRFEELQERLTNQK